MDCVKRDSVSKGCCLSEQKRPSVFVVPVRGENICFSSLLFLLLSSADEPLDLKCLMTDGKPLVLPWEVGGNFFIHSGADDTKLNREDASVK